MRRGTMPVVGAVIAAAAISAGGAVMPAMGDSELLPASLPSQSSSLIPHSLSSSVPTYTPAASRSEAQVIDAARLIGIPVVRTAQFPTASPVAFFCAAALSDRQFPQRLRSFVATHHRALITSRLASRLGRLPSEFAGQIFVLPSGSGSAGVVALPQAEVDRLRNFVLFPLGLRMEAPPRVSLALVGRSALVVENHNPYAAGVKLTFLTEKWPAIQGLASEGKELPLMGTSITLQTPPKGSERFEIVSRR